MGAGDNEADLGFGITAASRAGHAELGAAVQALGYGSLWVNDTPAGSALATLAECAEGARRLRVASGVIALDRRSPASIAEEATRLSLPRERLVVGVGSGSSRSLALVAHGVGELRRLLPGVAVAVAALGPRMCRLAGETADVVLLNWALPARIVESRAWIAEGASAAGREAPRIAAYVRVAIGPDAEARLRVEQERYLGRTPQYRDALGSQGQERVGIAAADGNGIGEALAPYREVLDETIVRGLPAGDSIEEWIGVAEAAAG